MFSIGAKSVEKNNWNFIIFACNTPTNFKTIPIPVIRKVYILNTSITIVFGFSILVLSKFIPTIYFGVFTGLAMLLAMVSVLTLLPSLILLIKPFNK